ncbi:hypothetical protein QZH41_014638 [Actinostola sp. cb2023]|nr:hypothetical protein QZH41_014638 [Actinostola sp. cb2023]
MSRQVPWRRSCPDVVSRRIEQANQARIYLLRETGPTGFLVKEDGVEKKFKVFLGDLHSCTCSTFMKEKELCIHILWVLLKKFRVPTENAVVFQLSLVEREINEVIRGAFAQHRQPGNQYQNAHADNRDKLKQKDIAEDDVCPICQDELLTKSGEPLTYCKYGCGNSIHLKCMKVWAEHQRSTGEKIMKCPLCRVDFGSFQELLDEFHKSSKKKTRAERQDIHLGAMCHKCRFCPIAGKCYRCVICVDYHLCHQCFSTDHHMQHSFQFRQNSSQRWRPASRVTPLPNAVMDQLQARDITEADYDLLLQLDRYAPLEDHEGVAGHVLSSIPVEILREHHPFLSQKKNCGICLHGYQPFQCIRKLQCRHTFHRDCIDNWLSSHSTCPVDGGSITTTIANEWSGSNDVSQPVNGRDQNNKALTQRQRLLVRRREYVDKQEHTRKSLPSTFSLSGFGILVRDRSR